MRFNEMDAATLAELSRRGGLASGESRRARRAAIETAKIEADACSELRAKLAAACRREAAALALAARSLRPCE